MKKLLLTLIIVLSSVSIYSQQVTTKNVANEVIQGITIRYVSNLNNNIIIEYAYFNYDFVGNKILISGYTPRTGRVYEIFNNMNEVAEFINKDWSPNNYVWEYSKRFNYIERK